MSQRARSAPAAELDTSGLDARVAEARERLDEAGRRAGLHDDPLGSVLGALSEVVGVMPHVARDIAASRLPIGEDDLRRLIIAARVTSSRIDADKLRRLKIAAGVGPLVALLLGLLVGYGWAGGFSIRCGPDKGGVSCGYWVQAPTK